MIFWRTLKKHIRTNGAVTVWLVIGVIVCAYCISNAWDGDRTVSVSHTEQHRGIVDD